MVGANDRGASQHQITHGLVGRGAGGVYLHGYHHAGQRGACVDQSVCLQPCAYVYRADMDKEQRVGLQRPASHPSCRNCTDLSHELLIDYLQALVLLFQRIPPMGVQSYKTLCFVFGAVAMRTAHSRVCVCVLKSSHAEKPTVHHNPTHAALQERLDLQPCATPRHVALCRRHASPSNSASTQFSNQRRRAQVEVCRHTCAHDHTCNEEARRLFSSCNIWSSLLSYPFNLGSGPWNFIIDFAPRGVKALFGTPMRTGTQTISGGLGQNIGIGQGNKRTDTHLRIGLAENCQPMVERAWKNVCVLPGCHHGR